MSQFIETKSGYVNLALVARIGEREHRQPNETKGTTYTFYGPEDRVLGTRTVWGGRAIDFETMTAPVVPAAPGTMACVLWLYTEGNRPTDEHICESRQPIVAWRIPLDGAPQPVLLDPPISDDEAIFIEVPAGFWRAEHGQFATIEEAKAAFLKEAQQTYDWLRLDKARKQGAGEAEA